MTRVRFRNLQEELNNKIYSLMEIEGKGCQAQRIASIIFISDIEKKNFLHSFF